MEEEICVLDPGPSSGGQGGRKGPMGRAGGGTSPRRLGEVSVDNGHAREEITSLPYHDSTSSADFEANFFYTAVGPYDSASSTDTSEIPLYDTLGDFLLGADEDVSSDDSQGYQRRCFNCGSPQHIVTACPEVFNKELVSLTRQLYQFFNEHSATAYERIHEVEGWRKQRAEWLEAFEPGQVRGDLLREALNIQGDDEGEYVEWLRNIACWGYPRGWTGLVDPRETVHKIITGELEEETDPVGDDEDSMTIFGDDGDQEQISMSQPTKSRHTIPVDELHNPLPVREHGDDVNAFVSDTVPNTEYSASPKILRWAIYPDTYFLSSVLPVYNGFSLPPLPSDSTIHHVYLRQTNSPSSAVRRHLGASSSSISTPHPPPPPASTPPPLPPMLPIARPLFMPEETDNGSESDMDLSD